MSIGGDGVLIVGVDLGLFLLAGEFCTTVESGSLNIHYKLPLLSGS